MAIRQTIWLLLVAILVGPVVANVRAEVSSEDVRQAIDRGVSYLKQQQKKDGSWPDWITQPGGVTVLCTLALLSAGVEPDEEHVQRALAYLRKLTPEKTNKTYSIALATMVFARAEPKRDLPLVRDNVKWFEANQKQSGPRKGAWGYPEANGDNSNSQFALLALHEAERAGAKVSNRTWRLAKAYWEDAQNIDGSWGYYKPHGGTGSMTCAGIASLVITSDKVRQSDARVVAGRIQCCALADSSDDRIGRGLQWLGRHFSVSGNPGARGRTWMLYYLYGVERVGRLTAQRFIGGHDWYREGTDRLVAKEIGQSAYWKGIGHAENNPLIATSLALLFLSKGRRPVLLSKLKHGPEDDWNRHRGDVGNLTRYVESRWKRDLTHQVVDLKAATVEDLVQSPVLYFAGSESPLPANAAEQQKLARKLRDYLDRGGFLFAEGNCCGTGFDQGFRKLIALMFPEPEYRLRLLEPEHPIWRVEQRVAADQLRPLGGIEFGCRTSVVYAPCDPPRGPRPSLSCLWELSRGGREEKFSRSVQSQIDAAMAIGINVLAYATNRELKFKDEIPRTSAGTKVDDQLDRGRLVIANLRHPGGCNAAPRAVINLLEAASRELKIRAGTRRRELNITDKALFDYHLVFMHGRNTFHLTDAERKQLGTYIERGGMLFADSICASRQFTESFRREMKVIFPDRPLKRIPTDDPMLTPAYGGFDLSTVTRRDPQRSTGSGPLEANLRKVPPLLDGIKFGDRWGVVFSPYDLSCALEKHDSLECQGYTREDAARIGLNIVVYSLQQ